MRQRYHSIDALRTVAIFFVVTIHTNPFNGMGILGVKVDFVIDTFARFAVPFFFIVSGYFFTANVRGKDVVSYYRKYAKKLASIYVLGLLLALPVRIIQEVGKVVLLGKDPAIILAELTFLSRLLYYGDLISVPLWFIPALFYAVGILALFIYYDKETILVPVSIVLYVVGVLGQLPMVSAVPIRTRDAVFFGLPFVILGSALARWSVDSRVNRTWVWGTLFVASSAVHIYERYLIGYVYGPYDGFSDGVFDLQFSPLTVFPALFLMLFALSAPEWGRDSLLERLGKFSLGLYIVHPPLLDLVYAARAGIALIYHVRIDEFLVYHLVLTPLIFLTALAVYLLLGGLGFVDYFYEYEGEGDWVDIPGVIKIKRH